MFFNNLGYFWQKRILSFSLPLSSRSQPSPPHMLNHLKVKFWRFLYIFPHSDVSSRTPHFVGRSCCTAVNREDAMRRPLVLRLGEKMVTHRFHVPLQGVNGHKCSQLCVCLRRLIIINVVAPPPAALPAHQNWCVLCHVSSQNESDRLFGHSHVHTHQIQAQQHTHMHTRSKYNVNMSSIFVW